MLTVVVGFTVISKDKGVPTQPFALGVTVMVAVDSVQLGWITSTVGAVGDSG